MKSLLVKAMMPIAAFMLASAGAVSTTGSTTESSTVDVIGWKRIGEFNCQQKTTCNNIENLVCKAGGFDMYGKPTPQSDCTVLLTHKLIP